MAKKIDESKVDLLNLLKEKINDESQIRLADYYKKIGRLIHDRRKERGLTQAQLAYIVGCETGYIGRIEGGTAKPSPKMLSRICMAVKVKPHDMIILDSIDVVNPDINLARLSDLYEITEGFDESKMVMLTKMADSIRNLNFVIPDLFGIDIEKIKQLSTPADN